MPAIVAVEARVTYKLAKRTATAMALASYVCITIIFAPITRVALVARAHAAVIVGLTVSTAVQLKSTAKSVPVGITHTCM